MYNTFSWNISVDFIMNHNYNQASDHPSELVLCYLFFFTLRDSGRNINFSRSFKESEAEVGME